MCGGGGDGGTREGERSRKRHARVAPRELAERALREPRRRARARTREGESD